MHKTLLSYILNTIGLEFNGTDLGLCGDQLVSRQYLSRAHFRSGLQQSVMAVPWSRLRSERCPANVMCNASLTSKVVWFLRGQV